ncbi:hypothetical protein LTR37_012642 [Vermiconidia calcicola]|uniref:Uncharacterized protein n=1 Tax=Vermiconidia calcicola TaxID=1690605 RepID=A0ACC3N1I3_9PEZI|nr:hypothetical protein LTR37_012642 [Vermiconidia calcicola]
MPVITEEGEYTDLPSVDFSELLDLPETAFTGSSDLLTESSAIAEPFDLTSADWPEHPGSTNCLGDGSAGNWDFSAPANVPPSGLGQPDYAKFENWIPQFIRPSKPCDYCRVRRLACYITPDITSGETACNACKALFRECSLTNNHAAPVAYALDTLHVVDENAAKEWGTVTGFKLLRSQAGAATSLRPDDAPGSTKRNGIRFPRHAVKTLRDWIDAHADNPYPTEEEKAELERTTELKQSQIANWLANARRRRKVSQGGGGLARPKIGTSPSLRPTTPAIAIPQSDKPWDELDPFERWKNSPPEHEPASITDIANAVANSDLPDDQVSTSPSSMGRNKHHSSNGSLFSNRKAPSSTSFETGQTSSLSASTSAANSQHSSQSHGSFGSFSSSLAGKKDRRRRRRPAQSAVRKDGDEKKRIFQCTFCTDTFKSKYDWTRHEKSLHLSLEKWICAPLGQCEEKGFDARTFYRKDHLRQHMRLMHNCEMTAFMDTWKSTAVNINSRCGFCAERFTVWQERVDHLTAHFKAGARLAQWKGCRGLDPAVAAQVTNAMPPYLIGIESVSPEPFSASNRATWRQAAFESGRSSGENLVEGDSAEGMTGLPSKATCWEILTVRLGKYANEMARKEVVLTDEMLQAEARRILYDSDDTWNQTAADNPEWLDLFKKAHGLDFIPSNIGGQGAHVPEDLETYGDLGLRVPFAGQLEAYNRRETGFGGDMCDCDKVAGQHLKSHHNHKVAQLNRMWTALSKEGVMHKANCQCSHTECDDNVFEISVMDDNRVPRLDHYRWCTYEMPADMAKNVVGLTRPMFRKSIANEDFAEDSHQRSKNVAQGLKSLYETNTRLCSGRDCNGSDLTEHDARIATAKAKTHGLSTPSHHSPLAMVPDPQTGTLRKPYLQRHRYELPKDRVQRFATTTKAWQDSGLMPDTITTVPAPAEGQPTSTGAMMEFLGGDLGQDLPFSTHVETSQIPLAGLDWSLPNSEQEEPAINRDIDKLIAETTAAQAQQSINADLFAPEATGQGLAGDPMMEDLDFDMDLDFEGVFDMPMEDTFYPSGLNFDT